MRFGQDPKEAAKDVRNSGGGQWFKYMKDGDTTYRLLQNPDDWVYWWEHFAGQNSFPCTNERETCPGCTSENEKTAKANRKVSFNVLEEGRYVNVYKVPPLLADKFKLRYERIGTLTDRDYTVTRYKSGADKVDYDVEANAPAEIDLSKFELKDIEQMLVQAYDEAWGDSAKVKATKQALDDAEAQDKLKARMDKAQAEQPLPPPSEPKADAKAAGETEVSEADLRAKSFPALVAFLTKEGVTVNEDVLETGDVNTIVDWLLVNQS